MHDCANPPFSNQRDTFQSSKRATKLISFHRSPKSPSSISLEDAETGQGGGGGIIGGGLGVGEQGASRKRSRNDQPEKAASPITAQDLNHLKSYGNPAKEKRCIFVRSVTAVVICPADIPDILICGNCKEMFTSVSDIIDHKKNYCKLRFACKCGPRTNYDIITTINRRGGRERQHFYISDS